MIALAGCSSSGDDSTSASPSASPTPANHVVTDLSGAQVTVPTTINKIAEQFPAHTVTDVMLGVGDKLVAIPQNVSTIPFMQTVQPGIAKVPQLFRNGGMVNMEQLLQRKPDVVSLISGGDTATPFKNAGVPAVSMFFTKLDDITKSMTVAGATYGGPAVAKAKAYNAYYEKVSAALSSKLSGATAKPKVLFIEAYTGGSDITVQGGASLIDQWIEKAGGTDAAKDIKGNRVKVTMEQVLQWNPDYLIVATPGGDQGLAANTGTSVVDALSKLSGWNDLNAVKNNKLYIHPRGLYPWGQYTPEQAVNLQWVAKVLNPPLFSDVDLRSVTSSFYQTYFGHRPTADELTQILQTAAPDGIATPANAVK
ncbi:ABC transporter substrate-binding protein [Frankia sp. R82]|uniref:ABC transporter substrate-binding protein n=1 Tax=Frankia sp. R82 TaxID=2950553 RepID=UPI00204449C2|nr:ABC transporter substrate-binding protein [Frankia sp. R82]MCM3886163.1 ABC transporter substrate-binding protein [Frankia sp. R82]